ncbi:MAG: thioredoxin domain-containing protein, partial [Gammaproteobacteria bacterium]
MDTAKYENALIHETSPYLLQHAHNPVQWYPWGKEALERARQENKPILLSIGYSACHWCHVMAHESFEDPQTAAVMNEHFINIKVDREERPDLDRIYQAAQYLLTQRTGGWPLTMFLTPDQLPFFGGTYFPPVSRYSLPGFRDLLLRVADYYRDALESIRKQNVSMLEALQQLGKVSPADTGAPLHDEPLHIAVQQLAESYDPVHGGFGGAPKFPHPSSLELLLLHFLRYPEDGESARRSLNMLEHTLRNMAEGGIYDQLGGGFSRYSVDERWRIPHFEKMLYDNGPLLTLYTQTWQITRQPLYKTIALESADWVMREMQSPAGGYYSSLDADSEGHEGKFYVWDRAEIRSLLDTDEFAIAEKYFGLDQPPNFEGHWHLHVTAPLEPATEQAVGLLRNARHKLLATRNTRIRPGRDEKILTSWNALMIKGMATAAAVFDDAPCFLSAERALKFLYTELWRNGRLLATCKDGKAHLNAYLDDHAFLIDAILALLSYRWNPD